MLNDFRLDNATVMVAPEAGFYATPGQGLGRGPDRLCLKEEDIRRSLRHPQSRPGSLQGRGRGVIPLKNLPAQGVSVFRALCSLPPFWPCPSAKHMSPSPRKGGERPTPKKRQPWPTGYMFLPRLLNRQGDWSSGIYARELKVELRALLYAARSEPSPSWDPRLPVSFACGGRGGRGIPSSDRGPDNAEGRGGPGLSGFSPEPACVRGAKSSRRRCGRRGRFRARGQTKKRRRKSSKYVQIYSKTAFKPGRVA